MIVRDTPNLLHLILVMQGSIVPRIIGRILAFAGFALAVLLIDRHILPLPHVSIAAMGVFGIALSLFLGFRNNAAYDRWWEARKLWGQMIADTRSLGRETLIFLGQGAARDAVMTGMAGFAHLHRGWLRGVAATTEAGAWDESATRHAEQRNPPDAALRAMAGVIRQEAEAGRIDAMGQRALAERFGSVALAQAGCERLASAPIPFVYSLLVLRTSHLYCLILPFALIDTAGAFAPAVAAIVAYVFFGLNAVSDELEHPFRDAANGLPLDAMCRVIEISVAEALGREPPEPMRPVDGVLS
ncbi:MAG: bestrophin family ion channel [Albidovulum sp.]|uniref:bestrophin family protein n=1 Tax=Albidovulum sp. TaxID=1872424 RepID=UPI003CC1AC0B